MPENVIIENNYAFSRRFSTCFRGNEKDLRDRSDTTVLVYTKLFRQICIEGYHRHKVYRGQKRAFALSVSSTKLFLKRNKKERKEKKG